MTALDMIKNRIQKLYKTNPQIHINVSMNSPKISLHNEPVIIKGVYPHIFQIEEKSTGIPKYHTLHYADILTRHIEIAELIKNN